MLRDFLSSGGLRNWLGQAELAEGVPSAPLDAAQPETLRHVAPVSTGGERCRHALENLNDAELAGLGLSRGVLALRAGYTERGAETVDRTPVSG